MPTGSTTSALVSILQQTTQMLKDKEYVAMVSLDLTKAFDSVIHETLAYKLAAIPIPDEIYNWAVDFLRSRSYVTRYKGESSSKRMISVSVVHGSGFGPSAFIVCASYLHPVNEEDKMALYADDAYLMMCAALRHTVIMDEIETSSSGLKKTTFNSTIRSLTRWLSYVGVESTKLLPYLKAFSVRHRWWSWVLYGGRWPSILWKYSKTLKACSWSFIVVRPPGASCPWFITEGSTSRRQSYHSSKATLCCSCMVGDHPRWRTR